MGYGRQIDASILVISHGTRERTVACLDAILSQTRALTYEVIAVDRASSDASANAIGEHPIRPRLFALKSDTGRAHAVALAASMARGASLVVIDSCVVIGARAIDRLVELADARPDALIWGGRILDGNGRPHRSDCHQLPTPSHLLARALSIAGKQEAASLAHIGRYTTVVDWPEPLRAVDLVPEHLFLIRRPTWEALGGLDGSLPEAAQVADLCLRARALGARPIVARAAAATVAGRPEPPGSGIDELNEIALCSSLVEAHWTPRMRPLGRFLLRLWTLRTWTGCALRSNSTDLAARRALAGGSKDRTGETAITGAIGGPRLVAPLAAG